jgi:DNA-binding response OmpR family regulator
MSGDLSALKELENAGADICLSKPFGLDELQSAIENRFRALSSRHAFAAGGSQVWDG